MKDSKYLALGGLSALFLSSCYYNDYGSNGYDGGYGTQYGQQGDYGAPTNQAPGNYGQQPSTGGTYGTESGDVTTYPGDGGAPNYGTTPPSYGTTTPGYGAPTQGGYGSTPATGGGRSYSVQKGDNLYRIGKKYGVSMQEIIQANGLSDTTIHPGQELIIP